MNKVCKTTLSWQTRASTAAFRLIALVIVATATSSAQASLGIFEHGPGIKSQGAGGVSFAFGEDSNPISSNPALTAALGNRNDVGISVFLPEPHMRYRGNSLGPDERFDSDGQDVYPIPQGGFTRQVTPTVSMGFSLYTAGLGPDYTSSPFVRFGSAQRTSVTLVSTATAWTLAWKPRPSQAVGVSINPGYQMLRATGLQFLSGDAPQTRVSVKPDRITDMGFDGSLSMGAAIGWQGSITPSLSAGLSYRTKTWTQRHREYRGLLPDGGSLELPAIWGGGLAWTPTPAVILAVDYQRFEFSGERGFGNRIGNLLDGNLFGSKNGPGFGLMDTSAYKFGAIWRATNALTLRAGYIHSTHTTRETETLFDSLSPCNTTEHYTAGATWNFGRWELSGFAAYTPGETVRGRNSVAPSFGGGEVDTSYRGQTYGTSIGWGFGR